MFKTRGDDMLEGLGVTLEHIRKCTIKCLAGLVACFCKAMVGRACKWVTWLLGMGGVLPVLVSSEILGIKPGLDVFVYLLGFLGETGLKAPH